MKRVATAAVLIPVVLALVLLGPRWLLAIVAGVVALLALREYLDIVEAHGYRPLRRAVMLLLAVLLLGLAASAFGWEVAFTDSADATSRWLRILAAAAGTLQSTALYVGPLVLLGLAMRQDDLKQALPVAASSALGLVYIGIPFTAVVGMHSFRGAYFTVFLLVIVWAGDIAAYYVGRRWGRRKLAPRISPNKTWEGATASVVAATFLGVLLHQYWASTVDWLFSVGTVLVQQPESHPIWLAAVFAIVGNIAAQFGDLAESALKRGAGLKDSGSILPGHGGMLDRIDALLFAAPLLYFYPDASLAFRL
jgi:phosphatidate cytidylyltransferase